LSYKPNTNDVRESPALVLAERMIKSGAKRRRERVGFRPGGSRHKG
jgi:UDP-glucose 6-dehydrogenase